MSSRFLPPRHERTPSPGRAGDEEEDDLATTAGFRTDPFDTDVDEEREQRLRQDFPNQQQPVKRLRRTINLALQRVSSKRKWRKVEDDHSVLDEKRRRLDTKAAKTELQEFHNIIGTLQDEAKHDWRTALANDAIFKRYLTANPKLPVASAPAGQGSTMASAEIKAQRILWRTVKSRSEAARWPVKGEQTDSKHSWPLGDELAAALEKQWRSRSGHVDAQSGTDANQDEVNEERSEVSQEKEDEDQLRPEDGIAKLPQEPPLCRLEPFLTAAQLELRNAIMQLPLLCEHKNRLKTNARSERSLIDWQDLLQILKHPPSTVGESSRVHLATDARALALKHTEERLRDIYCKVPTPSLEESTSAQHPTSITAVGGDVESDILFDVSAIERAFESTSDSGSSDSPSSPSSHAE